MKIAYIILAHKLPEQLVRLVRKLNDDDARFFIHIDKRTADPIRRRMVEPLSTCKNIEYLKRHAVNWGDFGCVEATLEGLKQAAASGGSYDYTILLTGQCYPIKSNAQIKERLGAHRGGSFIEYFPLPHEPWQNENGGLDRLNFYYVNWRGRRRSLFKRALLSLPPSWLALVKQSPIWRLPPADLDLFGGSAYWCLTRDCVEYINDFARQNRKFVDFFKYSLIPDEILFQTILLNSPLKDRMINDNLRYILWSSSSHPYNLGREDASRFVNSDKLFARKFDTTVDSEVLDLIDQATA